MGGPPAWAKKLVKPEVMVNKIPVRLLGEEKNLDLGKKTRCARKSKVQMPTMPDTHLASSVLNDKYPKNTPKMDQGINHFKSSLSKSFLKACKLKRSSTNKTGIKMAAADGTLTIIAIKGTAIEPRPEPKPLLLMPKITTAGMATP